jgi:hypothetical protein
MVDNFWDEGKQLACGPNGGIMFHGEQRGSCVGVSLSFVSTVGSSY